MTDTSSELVIRAYEPADEAGVVALWESCDLVRPWNDPHKDIAAKLEVQGELFLIGVIGERIVGSVMAGYDGHRGWINYLGVSPDLRGKGLARKLMVRAEEELRKLGCPKINLQVRKTSKSIVAFYEHMGFTEDDCISMGKRLD